MKNLKIYSIIITSITIVLLIVLIFILSLNKEKITKLEAQNIAYKYVSVKEEDVYLLKNKKEMFDNEYEIKFTDDKYIYEFEIDSKTGRVINFEKELINKKSNNNKIENKDENKKEENSINLKEEEAKKIVLKYLELNEGNVIFTKSKIDRENGKTVYEFELFDDKNEYEISVDVNNKSVVKYSKESLKINANTSDEYISREEVKEVVLEHSKLKNKDVIWHNVELDIDYNIKTYEIEFYYNNLKYEYEVDANTGTILKYETDRD